MSTLIPDTNILINYPAVLQQSNIVIPYCVLEELDELKYGEVSYEARKASRVIAEKEISCKRFDINGSNTDNKLIKLGKLESTKVVTEDILLYLKARASESNVELYEEEAKIYEGVVKKKLPKGQIDSLYNDKAIGSKFNLHENQFVDAGKIIARHKEGQLHKVDWRDSSKKFKPFDNLNRRQIMALDLLLDPEISIVALTGKAGTGKTSLAINSALRQARAGLYDRIVLSTPKVQRGNSEESIGYLPGNLKEKLDPLLAPFYDNIESQLAIDFDVVPLSMIQGRNFKRTIWLITEFENVRATQVDCIVERIGKGSKLIVEGDVNQKIIRTNIDGLTAMTSYLKDQPLAGNIHLTDVERSETAKLGELLRERVG